MSTLDRQGHVLVELCSFLSLIRHKEMVEDSIDFLTKSMPMPQLLNTIQKSLCKFFESLSVAGSLCQASPTVINALPTLGRWWTTAPPRNCRPRPLDDGAARTWAAWGRGGDSQAGPESPPRSGLHATGSGNSNGRSQGSSNCHRNAEGTQAAATGARVDWGRREHKSRR